MITKASGTREKQRKLVPSIIVSIIIIIMIIINNNNYFLNAVHFINCWPKNRKHEARWEQITLEIATSIKASRKRESLSIYFKTKGIWSPGSASSLLCEYCLVRLTHCVCYIWILWGIYNKVRNWNKINLLYFCGETEIELEERNDN